MADQPLWRGKFVDREWLKSLIRDGLKRCARRDVESVIDGMVNDIEEYIAGEILLNTDEALGAVVSELQEVLTELQKTRKVWRGFAEGIPKHQIKRRAKRLGRDDAASTTQAGS